LNPACSFIIIAGGSRIQRTEDAGVAGVELADILAAAAPGFDDIIVVAADPAAFLEVDALIVSDHYTPAGLWSGVHAGLFAARHPFAFVTACGLPLPAADAIERLTAAASPRCDAVIPEGAPDALPLPGVYGKTCLKPLAQQLAGGDSDGMGWLRRIRIHTPAGATVRPGRKI
jgi:molybdopterin-guanine dinucleotide biosynthesis protein A